MTRKAIGVDIGGTHITAGLVDLINNRLLKESVVRMPVNAQGNADQIISEWASCIAEVIKFPGLCQIGIAMPGPFDYEEGVSFIKDQGKYDSLYKANVKKLLADRLGFGVDCLHFQNDAASFLKGEVAAGAARDVDSAIGITLGTGLGSSFYMNGHGEDADLWHLPFKDGIVEDYLSTRWFVAQYEQRTGHKVKGVKEMIDSETYNYHVRSLFIEFANNLSVFLKLFIKMKEAGSVVIGGNIAKAHSYYLSMVQSNLQAVGVDVLIKISQLGERAALIGAAYAWRDQSLKV